MTENNKDNNKNIFVQFFEWCKRTFLHPTTVSNFVRYSLTCGLIFFILLFYFFYNKNTKKFQTNKNGYASVSIGPKRNLKSFPYIAQLNNDDTLLFCGYSYDRGSEY